MTPAAQSRLPSAGDAPADVRYRYRRDAGFSLGMECKWRLVAAVIPCLAGIGWLYHSLASARDLREYPAPGTMVDVDGCRLHLRVAGTGSPPVILETGLGGMSCAWGWIHPEIAAFTQVVAYDRAGLGWSAAAPGPGTAEQAALRLRGALRRLGIDPPYVLVGHSMGGLLVRVFADLFPDEAAGMVLLDAAHPDQHLLSPAISLHMQTGFRLLKFAPLLARLGYVRLTRLFGAWSKGLPPEEAAQADAFLCSHRHLGATRDESLVWESVCDEVRSTKGLGDMPLAVVTAGRDVLPGQPELQKELTALSSDSLHLVVRGADHVTLVTRRRYALSVVDAIRHVVERVHVRQPGARLT